MSDMSHAKLIMDIMLNLTDSLVSYIYLKLNNTKCPELSCDYLVKNDTLTVD